MAKAQFGQGFGHIQGALGSLNSHCGSPLRPSCRHVPHLWNSHPKLPKAFGSFPAQQDGGICMHKRTFLYTPLRSTATVERAIMRGAQLLRLSPCQAPSPVLTCRSSARGLDDPRSFRSSTSTSDREGSQGRCGAFPGSPGIPALAS